MKTKLLVKLAFLFLAISTISGCLLVPMDEGGYRGNNQERSRGGHHGGDHHENNDRR